MGVRATGVAEVGAVGTVVFAVVLGSSGIFVAKEINVQNNQRIVLGSYQKKKRKRKGKKENRRSDKGKRHIPMASVSRSPPSSSSESETIFFMIDSSLEFSRTSLDPSFEDKSTSGPRLVELGIDQKEWPPMKSHLSWPETE